MITDGRPSHAGMEINSCTSAGCHNFHNIRALYTGILTKHMDDPNDFNRARVPGREFYRRAGRNHRLPTRQLPVAGLVARRYGRTRPCTGDGDIEQEWLRTARARSGVNCSACHQPRDDQGERTGWQDKPAMAACTVCHGIKSERFGKGKHGM